MIAGVARAQPAPREPVGANEIFDALTRPDAPSDLQLLRGLRQSLATTPDQKTLNEMRGQLDALLRDAERRQGEMPPALVMSGIAARIDGAITRLEAARTPAAALAPQGPPWLLPALAGLSGTLAIGLAACLAMFASQGKTSAENDELHEALTKLRRRLEDVAAGNVGSGSGPGREESQEALQDFNASVTRIGHSAKEAENQLRVSTEAAEQRLQGAAAIAGQLEVWLQSLPGRLGAAIAQVEGGAAPSSLAAQALLLPDLVSTLQAACETLRGEADAFTQTGLAMVPPTADIGGFAQSASLATEMTNLSYGHAVRLDDVVARIEAATTGLSSLIAALNEAGARLPEQVDHNAAVTENLAGAIARAEHTLVELGQFIEQRLPDTLAQLTESITARGIAALDDSISHCTEIASTAASAAAALPQSLATLQDAAAALSHANAEQQATLSEANARLSSLTEILPDAGAKIAAAAEAFKLQLARETKRTAASRAAITEIALAAQAARADLAAATDAAAAMPAQNARLAELLSQGEAFLARLESRVIDETDTLHHVRDDAFASVEAAITKVQAAAERLHAGADAQEQSLARVRRAAMTVATLAGVEPPAAAQGG